MITASYSIEGGDFARAGGASRGLKDQLRRIGVEAEVMRRAMIAAYEAEMNVVVHAARGTLWARVNDGRLDLEVVDEGPGIQDIGRAMEEGYSTAGPTARALGFGAGLGLPNIRKSSDRFLIDTQIGRGTRVRATIFLQTAAAADGIRISAETLSGRCRGCLSCLKACPTGAVRVRNLHPEILQALCVDCTECIAACPAGAFALRDLGGLQDQEVPAIADLLVLPLAFLTGFGVAADPGAVLRAIAAAGFPSVRFTEEWEAPLRSAALEVAAGAPAEDRPVITPLCPAVVNLVAVGFPSLLSHIAPLLSPVEALRDTFRFQALSVVPACPSQQALLEPDSLPGRLRVLPPERLRELVRPHLSGAADRQTAIPVAPAGERRGGLENPAGLEVLRAGGMRHVLKILEAAEKGLLGGIEVLELSACPEGCFGSPLFLTDPFIALGRHRLAQPGIAAPPRGSAGRPAARPRSEPAVRRKGVRLHQDMSRAIEMLSRIDAVAKSLPGRDCGACGCPSCAALAEDIVLDRSRLDACPFAVIEEESS